MVEPRSGGTPGIGIKDKLNPERSEWVAAEEVRCFFLSTGGRQYAKKITGWLWANALGASRLRLLPSSPCGLRRDKTPTQGAVICRPGSNYFSMLTRGYGALRLHHRAIICRPSGTLEFRGRSARRAFHCPVSAGQSRSRASVNLVVPPRHNLTAASSRNLVHPNCPRSGQFH